MPCTPGGPTPAQVTLKLYLALNTYNEAGSATMLVQRPF